MNIGDPCPDLIEAEHRVLVMQTKLHQWAKADPGRRLDDLANLVYDPAFLVVAWARVRGNKGARTAGVDRVEPRSIVVGAAALLDRLRGDLRAGRFVSQRVREKTITCSGNHDATKRRGGMCDDAEGRPTWAGLRFFMPTTGRPTRHGGS